MSHDHDSDFIYVPPNHAEDCELSEFKYSGKGYNRVRVCECGAEDHDPEFPREGHYLLGGWE